MNIFKSKKRIKFLGLGIIFIVLLFLVLPKANAKPATQGEPPDLFTFPGGLEVAEQPDPDPSVVRTRQVNINLDLLGGDGRDGNVDVQGSPQVRLNLFDDVTLVAVLERIETLPSVNSEGYAWIGSLQDVEFSQVIFVVIEGKTSASIRYPDGVYQIRPGVGSEHQIQEIDVTVFEDHDPDYAEALLQPEDVLPQEQEDISIAADDGSIIDVMVVYTADARDGAGGTAAMESFINLNFVETNTSYGNSSVVPRIRLVYAYQVSYTETGNSSTDLTRLQGTSDGYMDDVHPERDTYAADLVLLLVDRLDGGACGRGYLYFGGLDTQAFSVVKRSCASGNLSFPHELGHNMGARHDWYVDDTTGDAQGGLSDNHGRTYNMGSWRTVMAYNTHCSHLGGSCTRVTRFSNPDVNYSGQPTGFVAGTNITCTTFNTGNPDCDCHTRR